MTDCKLINGSVIKAKFPNSRYQTALDSGPFTDPDSDSLSFPERFITFDEALRLTDSGISQNAGIEPVE